MRSSVGLTISCPDAYSSANSRFVFFSLLLSWALVLLLFCFSCSPWSDQGPQLLSVEDAKVSNELSERASSAGSWSSCSNFSSSFSDSAGSESDSGRMPGSVKIRRVKSATRLKASSYELGLSERGRKGWHPLAMSVCQRAEDFSRARRTLTMKSRTIFSTVSGSEMDNPNL